MYSTEHLVVKMAILKKYFCTESVSEHGTNNAIISLPGSPPSYHITHTNTWDMIAHGSPSNPREGTSVAVLFMCRQLTIHCVFFG